MKPRLLQTHVRCAGCGAPAGDPALTRCEYCTLVFGQRACPSCHCRMAPGVSFCQWCGTGTISPLAEHSALPCPCGSDTLQHRAIPVPPGTVGGVMFISDCPSCTGMWLGRDTVERLIASHADDSLVLALAPGIGASSAARAVSVSSTSVRYRKCPECSTIMNRVNYARISGIVVDVCKAHGTWFDAHELPALLEFVRRGGLDVARQRETIALADERRRLERERSMRTQADNMRGDRQAVWLLSQREDSRRPSLFSLLGDLLNKK